MNSSLRQFPEKRDPASATEPSPTKNEALESRETQGFISKTVNEKRKNKVSGEGDHQADGKPLSRKQRQKQKRKARRAEEREQRGSEGISLQRLVRNRRVIIDADMAPARREALARMISSQGGTPSIEAIPTSEGLN